MDIPQAQPGGGWGRFRVPGALAAAGAVPGPVPSAPAANKKHLPQGKVLIRHALPGGAFELHEAVDDTQVLQVPGVLELKLEVHKILWVVPAAVGAEYQDEDHKEEVDRVP